MNHFFEALRNSLSGLAWAARREQAARQELALLAAAVPLSYFLATSLWQMLALIGSVFLVLIVEMLNTAVEKLADRVTPDHDPAIGIVKDLGSSAVFLSLVLCGLTWLVALVTRFLL
jgi:diacylglycerol kinase (ATP)